MLTCLFLKLSQIGTKYENSPFYKGTKLWDSVNRDIQYSENKWIFKSHLNILYKKYKNEI